MMERKEQTERRSSILKTQHPPNVDNVGEISTTITAAVKRRVSFHNIRTVQEFDVEHSNIIHSPHVEPMKLHDTSSDCMTVDQLSTVESNDGDEAAAAKLITDTLSRTVENFAPMTTSTPLSRTKDTNNMNDDSMHESGDSHNDAERWNPAETYNGTGREETTYVRSRISEVSFPEVMQNDKVDILEVESMDMSDSDQDPRTTDATRKLFRQSTVMKPFITDSNQPLNVDEGTLASNATRMILKSVEDNGDQSSVANETLKEDAEMSSMHGSTVDMDISIDDEQAMEVPVNASVEQQLAISEEVADEATNNLFGANGDEIVVSAKGNAESQTFNEEEAEKNHAKVSEFAEEMKSNEMTENTQISDISSKESLASHFNVTHDASLKSERNLDEVTHFDDDATDKLSSQLNRQHISNEFLPSIRKTTLGSPAVLPKKKIRLMSPNVKLSPKTSTILFESPKIDEPKIVSSPAVCSSDKSGPVTVSESTASTDRSTDQIISEIKHRLRRSLNQSGLFTLTELTAADADGVPMLYDIPMPEPLFHSNDLSSQISTAEPSYGDADTAVEQSSVESSSLSSRHSEIATLALNNESSFLTSRIDAVGFEINFRTIPCLRIKPNEQPQIVELKQLTATNLRQRIADAVERCRSLVDAELPKCNDHQIAECIRTLNPRKLSKKDASWFEVCYLMAQRDWFLLRASLATLMSEKLDELLQETKTECDRRLTETMKEYQENHVEVRQRYAQLVLLDEMVTNQKQREAKSEQLKRTARALRLEIARKKLELTRKQGVLLEALVKEYEETKAEMEEYATKKAARRVEFLRKYDEEMAEYRDLLTEIVLKD